MNQNLTANENEDKKTTMEKMTEECLEEANEFYSIYERYERNAADLLNHILIFFICCRRKIKNG